MTVRGIPRSSGDIIHAMEQAIEPLSVDVLRQAIRQVTGHAESVEDATQLLDALGLRPGDLFYLPDVPWR